jgi:pterin-4a-carbinolamine dehydratase
MHRMLSLAVRLTFLLLSIGALSTRLCAQQMTADQWRVEFSKTVEIDDPKQMDRLMKRGPRHAAEYYEALYWEKDAGKEEANKKCLALAASWKRAFDNSDTLEQLDRWCSGATSSVRQQLAKVRDQSYRVWKHYTETVSKDLKKPEYEQTMQQLMELARGAETIGHDLEISSLWGLASVVASKMPEKSIDNKRDAIFATEQMLEARKRWNFTFDEHYITSSEWLKNEKLKLEAAVAEGDKRKTEGYKADAKGIDTLVMPNAVEAKHQLKFEALPNWDDADFGSKGGPVPAYWWMTSLEKVGSNRKIDWFSSRDLYLHRVGANKFQIAFDSGEPKNGVEIDATPKGKVSTFWLDADKKVPYAMVFWTGSDREMVNEAECNLAPNDNVANIYYRSAASWKTTIGSDTVTLYDDSANGVPGEATPWAREFRTPMLGEHDLDKPTLAPLLDSMRVGKGPRVPFSEFVKLASGWVHMKKHNGDEVGVRALNPDYVKTGKVKLVWAGNKATMPTQLVVQGSGDYETAFFDVGGGKEVEMPAGEYRVIWGRMLIGKGPRAQTASIYGGTSKPFAVEAGKTFELKMGAPFTLVWNRRGDENASIDALKILLAESSGCVFTEQHGFNLASEVLAAKDADGKGAKPVGKFVRFSDPELVNEAARKHNNLGNALASFPMPEGYKNAEMVLSVKLPAAGMKMSLVIKKHALFGDVKSAWQ